MSQNKLLRLSMLIEVLFYFNDLTFNIVKFAVVFWQVKNLIIELLKVVALLDIIVSSYFVGIVIALTNH